MRQTFLQFLQAPGRDTYLAVRGALIASPHYAPYSHDLEDIEHAAEKGAFDEARQLFTDAVENLLLSPRAHLLMAFVADKSGDAEAADMERQLASICCSGILATGDGSRAQPYVVARTSDAYDMLQYLDRPPTGQALAQIGNRRIDVFTCEDGGELCFDITEVFDRMLVDMHIDGQAFRAPHDEA